MNLDGIKNIIFDLGGVVLNIDYHLTEEAFYMLGISKEQIMYSKLEQGGLFDDLETGRISPSEFRNELREFSFLGLTDLEIDNAWNALLLDLPKKRIDLLKSLKPKYRTFLLSNTNKIHFNAYSSNLKQEHGMDGLESLFEKTYYSHNLGLRKPQPEIFKLVLDENGLKADETLFIDDSEQHIKAAQSLGIRTHHITGEEVVSLF
ncbi:MAG: HAD family phosphatase [Flavobacteriales bacterium]|nr:HAD family phosphatase [Flavobacteriales bacterium]